MPAEIIDGRKQAQLLLDNVANKLGCLPTAPGLAVVLVGDDPASHIWSEASSGSHRNWASAARRSSCRTASPPKPICFRRSAH